MSELMAIIVYTMPNGHVNKSKEFPISIAENLLENFNKLNGGINASLEIIEPERGEQPYAESAYDTEDGVVY